MSIKKVIDLVKPLKIIESIIIFLICLFFAKSSVGLGIFTDNMIFGSIIVGLITLTSFLVLEYIQRRESSEERIEIISGKPILIMMVIIYSIVLILTIIHSAIDFLGLASPLLIVILGLFWIGLYTMTENKRHALYTKALVPSVSFSIPILYAILINMNYLLVSGYFIFIGIFLLKFIRAFLKNHLTEEIVRDPDDPEILSFSSKVRIFMLTMELSSILLLILPFVFGIINMFLYFFPLMIYVAILLITLFYAYNIDLKIRSLKRVRLLLKISILFQILALFLGGI